MKAKDLATVLLKTPELEVYFMSAIAQPDMNIPVGYVFENNIMMYGFDDGTKLSYIPLEKEGEAVWLTNRIAIVLTDKKL